jgi:[protein-PII] uridylyltransferase
MSEAIPFRQAIASATDSRTLGALLAAERQRQRERCLDHPTGVRACRSLTEVCDLTLQQMLALSLPADPVEREATRPKISIAATGGYGRKELCPFSDLDVTFVVAEEEDDHLDATVRKLFLLLMETFQHHVGLKVGYAYRSLNDAAELDPQSQTALLDLRVVAGSHRLAEQFGQEVFKQVWPGAFVRRKLAERAEKRRKAGGTLFRIEPDLKEGPGCLRDLQLAEWLAAVSFPSTRGDVWRQLQRLGAVSSRDVEAMDRAREFLLLLRTWMHWTTDRAADTLTRERQEGLAEALQLPDDARVSRVERLMVRFYGHAEIIERVSGYVVDRCLTERLSLSEDLACSGAELQPAYPWVPVDRPQFLVEVGRHFQELGLRPGYDLRRMIGQQLDHVAEVSADPDAAAGFLSMFEAPPPLTRPGPSAGPDSPGVYETLRLLADLGVLQRLVPELGEAFARVPFDLVHQHSIGFHSLETVRSLEQLRCSTDDGLREFRRAWSEVQSPRTLYLAALLHDIGKLPPEPDHSVAGARMAAEVCRRLQLQPELAAQVELLVRHHLLFSETAQLRDITLDRTMADFTQVVSSTDLLNMLMLLTYADMEATGVLNAAKVRFILGLYYRAEGYLTASASPGSASPEEQERTYRNRVARHWARSNLTPQQIEEVAWGMPVSYLLNTRPEQVARHVRMMEALKSAGPNVEFENEATDSITSIHICTLERPEPGLLSQIAGVLFAHEVRVHSAQVFTRSGEPAIALDTIWADYHGRLIPPMKCMELEQDLLLVLQGTDASEVLERRRKRPAPAPQPHLLRINNELADGHSVLQIRVDDQPGLLYRITRAIAALSWDIHSARISTRGDEARDAFYITSRDGRKLADEDPDLLEAFLRELAR